MESPVVQKSLKDIFFNCLDYKNDPYFDKTRDMIRYLFKGEVMNEEEISNYMTGKVRNAQSAVMLYLAKGDTRELNRILLAYPQLTKDEELLGIVYRKISKYIKFPKNSINDKLNFVSLYNRVFQGELKKNSKLNRLVVENIGGWEPQTNTGRPMPQNPPQNPPQNAPQVEEDNFDDLDYGDREAQSWYNIFKTN
jgi:hypothetical protein